MRNDSTLMISQCEISFVLNFQDIKVIPIILFQNEKWCFFIFADVALILYK